MMTSLPSLDVDRVVAGTTDDGVGVVAGTAAQRIVAECRHRQVVAVAAIDGVVAATAEELVVGAVAVDDVVERIAGAVDRVSAGEGRDFRRSAPSV